jgi:hypothetical protein
VRERTNGVMVSVGEGTYSLLTRQKQRRVREGNMLVEEGGRVGSE